MVAPPRRDRGVGARRRARLAAVRLRLGGQEGHVHHELPRVGERQFPQGRWEGGFPSEDAVMKRLYLRVLELYRKWGEGCHQSGWSEVRNQLLCDESVRPRIERYL